MSAGRHWPPPAPCVIGSSISAPNATSQPARTAPSAGRGDPEPPLRRARPANCAELECAHVAVHRGAGAGDVAERAGERLADSAGRRSRRWGDDRRRASPARARRSRSRRRRRTRRSSPGGARSSSPARPGRRIADRRGSSPGRPRRSVRRRGGAGSRTRPRPPTPAARSGSPTRARASPAARHPFDLHPDAVSPRCGAGSGHDPAMTGAWDERAEAYRTSPTHREGDDLDALVAVVRPGPGRRGARRRDGRWARRPPPRRGGLQRDHLRRRGRHAAGRRLPGRGARVR